jgi:low affinity Fe/Cu permease
MTTELRDLADIDRRLDDALVQLREQQAMVALIDSEHDNKGVLLRLLSSVLEQFYSLQKHRRAVLKRDQSRPLD